MINTVPFVGTATAMHGWNDLSGNAYIGFGTEDFLYAFYAGTNLNVTPIRATHNVAVNFSTVINTKTVTIVDATHGAAATDWVNILVPVSVGGLVFQGYYQIQTIVDANTYTITASKNATSTVNNGGAVPTFQTVMSNTDVTVVLANHGYVTNNAFAVQVSLSIGGFTLTGTYAVSSVVDASTFKIQPGGSAGSSSGPNRRKLRQCAADLSVADRPCELAVRHIRRRVRAWRFRRWPLRHLNVRHAARIVSRMEHRQFRSGYGGELYRFSVLYLGSVHKRRRGAGIERHELHGRKRLADCCQLLLCIGSAADGDCARGQPSARPISIRCWCAGAILATSRTGTPQVTNAAGSYRIPTGSKIDGGISAPNFTVVWTDIDMWLMMFLGGAGTDVWGFRNRFGRRSARLWRCWCLIRTRSIGRRPMASSCSTAIRSTSFRAL